MIAVMAMAKTYQLSTKLFFSVLDPVIPSHLIMMISVWAAVDQIGVGCGLSGLWAALGVQTIFWVVCCQEIGCDWCGQLFVTSYILDGWQCFCKWTQRVLEYVLRDRKEPLAFGFALRKRDIRKKCICIWKYKGSGKNPLYWCRRNLPKTYSETFTDMINGSVFTMYILMLFDLFKICRLF